MLANIFLFELQQRLRRISTWVYFLVFFALGCLFTLMSGGAISGSSVDFGTGGKVLVNAPQEEVRQNRLKLLYELRKEFSKVADFSEIVTNS